MTVVHQSFKIQSDRMPTFHDVTENVQAILKTTGITNGIVVVYSQHTTCSVFVQEDADDVNYWGTKLLLQDLVNVFENIVPTCRTEGQYLHPGLKHIEMAKSRNEQPAWSSEYRCTFAFCHDGAVADNSHFQWRNGIGRIWPDLFRRL